MFGGKRKMMHGKDGNQETSNMTWDEYTKWQRWDEWPECADNPPLTVETSFWYENQEYMVTKLCDDYAIVLQPEFEIIISNKNFIDLLEMAFRHGKSFKELLPKLFFEK